jgi:hypothetical protein
VRYAVSVVGTEFVSRAPTLLSGPVFVGLLLFVSIVVGRRVLLALGAMTSATTGERLVAGASIGLGVLQFVPYLLGVFGVLGPTSVTIVFVALVLVSLIDAPAIIVVARGWWSTRRKLAGWEWAWLTLLAAPLLFSIFVALAPSFDPDGLGYHLTAPKLWLEDGSIGYLPTFIYANGPMGTEMLYAIGLSVIGDAGAKLIHLTASVLATVGIYLVGRRVRSPMVGRIACTLFLFGPLGIYDIIGFGYGEGTATLAIVASLLCWMVWFDERDQGSLRAAALLAGLAVSFKLTSLLFPAALALLTVLVIRARGRRATGFDRVGAKGIAALCALVAAPVVPWLARSLVLTGNPVFPVLARWIPSRDFPAAMSREFETYNRYMLWGNRWGYDLGIDSRRLILAGIAIVVVAIGVLAYMRLKDPVHRAVTIVIVLTVVLQLFAAGLYTRYWIPLGAVLLIPVIALIVSRLDARLVGGALLAVTALFAALTIVDGLGFRPADFVAASVDDDRRADLAEDLVPLLPVLRAASDDAAGRGTVMMTHNCNGFYIDGPNLCIAGLENSVRLSSWDEFERDLADLGVTHVVAPAALADGSELYEGNGAGSVGYLVREQRNALVSRLIRERGELLVTANGQSAYRLRPISEG